MSTVDIAPAPWHLTGHGYAIALRCTRGFARRCLETTGVEARPLGGVGAVMVINYATSDVGAYRELLLCPGVIELGGHRARAITHIWTSTRAAAVSGRHNWGLPKRQAVFAVDANEDGSETFTVHDNDKPPLTMTLAPRGPTLPVNTNVLPRSWRTLEQPWQGQCFKTTIEARGRGRYCSLKGYDNPSASGFPDFGGQKRMVGVAASRFELTFPEPAITTLLRG